MGTCCICIMYGICVYTNQCTPNPFHRESMIYYVSLYRVVMHVKRPVDDAFIFTFLFSVLAATEQLPRLLVEHVRPLHVGGGSTGVSRTPLHRSRHSQTQRLLRRLEEEAVVRVQCSGHVAPAGYGCGCHDPLSQPERLRQEY